jgi:hypothetical protein
MLAPALTVRLHTRAASFARAFPTNAHARLPPGGVGRQGLARLAIQICHHQCALRGRTRRRASWGQESMGGLPIPVRTRMRPGLPAGISVALCSAQ